LQATTREFGSALGVAVIGTILNAHSRGHDVATTFVSGIDVGLRVIGVTVLVLGALVVLQSRIRPGATEPGPR
jgi:hypothetical protein